jgi:hypothetical protein
MLIILVILVIFLISIILFYTIFLYRYFYVIYNLSKNRHIKSLEESRPHLLDKPLNEFYINSSHNSYLNYFQHVSYVRPRTLTNILKQGARCIELDISHINNKPIVAHGTKDFITTTYASLESFVDVIVKDGFNTSDPLILFCEIYNPENEILLNNIKKIFIDKLSNRIAKLHYNENYIADKPIKLFLNKIIIFSNNSQILSDISYPTNNYINREDNNDSVKIIKSTNQLGRIYKHESIYSFLSFNIDFEPLFKNKYNMVTMNYQMSDKLLYDYLKFFEHYNFIHFSETSF